MSSESSRLLLISASKADDTGYLTHAKAWLEDHIDGAELLFIPYAGVTVSHQDYTAKVQHALADTSIQVRGIESFACPKQAIRDAKAIAVGGGNTFVLLNTLYQLGLLDLIRRKVQQGTPYAGWSAGSNIAGLSIRTTNDMPIVQPPSFSALKLVPFQLNPHYTDFVPAGSHGETRDQRLAEFNQFDPHTPVLAIQEGTALKIEGKRMQLLGHKPGYVFTRERKLKLAPQRDCSQWL